MTTESITTIITMINVQDSREDLINSEFAELLSSDSNDVQYSRLLSLMIHEMIPLIDRWRMNWISIDSKLDDINDQESVSIITTMTYEVHSWIRELVNCVPNVQLIKTIFDNIRTQMITIDDKVKAKLTDFKNMLEDN